MKMLRAAMLGTLLLMGSVLVLEPAGADVFEKIGKKIKKGAKAVEETAKDVGDAVADVAGGLVDLIKKKIKSLEGTSIEDVIELANKAYGKLPKPVREVFHQILKGIVTVVGPLLDAVKKPFVSLLKEVADPLTKALGSRSSRRAELSQCSVDFGGFVGKVTGSVKGYLMDKLPDMAKLLGKGVGTAFKLGMLELLIGKISKTWQTMKNARDFGENQSGVTTATGATAAPKSLSERLSNSFKSKSAVAKASGIAVLAKLAQKLVEYPTAYLYGAASCVRDNKASVSRADYQSCYLGAFQEYSKKWLFSTITGMATAPLEALVVAPIATWIGTTVTSALATAITTLTAGVGASIAPLIGMATVAVVNTGIKELMSYGVEEAFYGFYEKTSWKGSCSFFKSLVSADVINTFGSKAKGDASSEPAYACP